MSLSPYGRRPSTSSAGAGVSKTGYRHDQYREETVSAVTNALGTKGAIAAIAHACCALPSRRISFVSATMNKDRLFLLRPSFADPQINADLFHCPACVRIEGLLAFFPFLRTKLDIVTWLSSVLASTSWRSGAMHSKAARGWCRRRRVPASTPSLASAARPDSASSPALRTSRCISPKPTASAARIHDRKSWNRSKPGQESRGRS